MMPMSALAADESSSVGNAEAEAKAKAGAEAVVAVQAMIGELPSLGELKGMDSDTLNEAYMAVQSAYDAYETLSEEQQAQVTGADRFEELFGWFNSQVAPLENSGNIYPDVVDANGGITAGTSFSRNGPVLTENDKNLSGKYYIVQSDMTINGNLTVDGSIDGGLVLCQGATLTVNGALIHSGGNAFYIYGQSNNGANVGELIINNSNGDGAAIRSESKSAPRLGISSGKVTINGGSSKKLVDNVELYSTKPIHEGILDGDAKLPSEWGASSISGGELVLDYCEHHNAVYTPSGGTQHIKSCKQCGFNTGNTTLKANCGNDGYERTVSVSDTEHRKKCPCGNLFGTPEAHTIETVPTHSKQHHVSGCLYCDYTSGSQEEHNWNHTTGECTGCGFKPIALDKWEYSYDSLQEAMNEASKIPDGPLVTLYSEASGNTAIDDEFEFNYPGKTITLDMAGHSLEHQGNPIITVEAGTLIVKGTATITKKADSPEQVNSAIVVKGGELIFEDTLNVTGSAENLSAAPAILVKGGTVTFEKDVTATAAENEGSSTLTNPAIAPAVKVTGGKLIFNGKLTATGGLGGVPKNTRPCEPAVYAEGGELEFNGDLDLNGGLTLTKSAKLANLLTQGTFSVSAGTGSSPLSVKDSSVYKKVSDLLAEGYACVKTDSLAEGKEKEYANTRAYTCSDNVTIVKHEHEWKLDSQYPHLHSCACGKSENHEYDSSTGKCKICQSECSHKNVDNDGTCFTCKAQMLVKIENGGNTTYSTDFKSAMKAAENGTTVKLLADIKWGKAPQARAEITGDGKIVTLNLNGHTITGGWIDIGDNNKPTSCTLKIIGEGGHESLDGAGGYSSVSPKAMLDLSEWEGGTISTINISDSSNYAATTREAAVIVGPNAGTIGKLSFGNNQLGELKKTKLSGGSFHEIWVAGFGPVKLGELLADGYAYQNEDGSYVKYETTLQGASIRNVKVVKCLHPNMKPGGDGVVTCEYCGKSGKFVASVDGNLYTADQWKDAFKAWLGDAEDEKANGILKLYTDYKAEAADATWSVGYRTNGNTLDLNGHRMSVQGDGAFKPTNNMHLTVTDSKKLGQIDNILLDGSQNGSFTLESGIVCNLKMTGGAVVALKGGSVDNLDVKNCSASTNLSIQGGSLGKLNIKDWADGMYVSATGGSLGAYTLPSGKILADVLDHQYYAEGTSLDRQVDTAQPVEKFVIKHAPHDFGSTTKTAEVPINGSIPFRVDSPSENVGVYDVKWYRRTDSGAEHMVENRVAGVNVNDKLDVFCVITGLDSPNNGTVLWQVAVKDYTIKVVPAMLSGDTTKIEITNADKLMYDGKQLTADVKVTYNGKELTPGTDYTVSGNTGTDARTYTLTITGKGNYGGEQSKVWTIKPRALGYPEITALTRKYDGTTALPGDFTLSKFKILPDDGNGTTMTLTQGKDFMLDGNYGDASVGENKAFTITITLCDNYHNGSGGNEMTLIQKDYTGLNASITKADAPKNAAGSVAVMNKHANDYEFDLAKLLPTLEAPKEYGAVTYGVPTVNLSSDYYTDGARVEDGKLILPTRAVETSKESNIGTIKVMVTPTNYNEFELTINVNATNKIVPTGAPKLSTKTLTYGQALSAIKLSGKLHDNVNNKDVEGTFTWADGTVKPSAGSYEAAWKFTPTDGDTYAETTGTVSITVNKAKPTGEPIYTKITAANKTLKDAALKPNTSWPTGTIQWVDKDGKELPDTTEVKANTAYKWIFTPDAEFAANYTTATGELTLYSVSTGGGGGGSSSGSTVKTDTVTNPDGSVTKTETRADGTKVETTTGKDGSTVKTETKKDGSSVTEKKAADGSTGTVKTDKNGQTTAETALSSKAIETAKRNGEPVKAPVEVKATRNSDTAPTVKVELPKNSGDTKVEIPVSNVNPGTVAVLVHPDGTEEIVKNSLPTEDGIQLTVNGGATVKIVDNSKNFIDTRNHWAKDAIDFVSARELVNGMNDSIYAPNNSTTRAQLWTILARQNDADLNGGNTWYEKAQLWSKNKGISDGTEPNAAINRAQMVTMLWRTMGQPAAGGAANFNDVPANSYYAQAVAWAVENGITAGVGGGRFDPNATCTRGQIATFLYRYMK